MKYGFILPYGDARDIADMALVAEEAGWDGFFIWDPVWGVDPWVSLAAAAMKTQKIRLGTMLTPISRRRPWKLASETATLDRLSDGRVILAVGLGAIDTGFVEFGEVTDRKTRAELMDESLEILTGLWRGQPFHFDGKHYHVKETHFYPPPPPVQSPRIPIWVVGAWPREKSMQRVLQYDGLLPTKMKPDGGFVQHTPDDIREIKAYIDQRRQASTPFDIVVEGQTPGSQPREAAEKVKAWADSGVTWWLESMWGEEDKENMKKRLQQGPPRIEEG